MRRISKAFISLVGAIQKNGRIKYSYKKIMILIASIFGLVVPGGLVVAGYVSGAELLDYYQILIPAMIGIYITFRKIAD